MSRNVKKRSNNGKSNKNVDYRKKRKLGIHDYIVIAFIVFIVLVLGFGAINENIPRNYYLKDIKLLQGTVIQKERDYDKYYIKVSPTNPGGFSISEDNSWIEVKEEFYDICLPTDSIGVKFANADVYKRKFWGVFGEQGQTFEENVWYIDEIYNTIDNANIANPIRSFNQQAIILKKKITKKGDYFFVINADNKSMPVMVQKETFNKYNVNDSLNCEFESIGDLIKFVKIV